MSLFAQIRIFCVLNLYSNIAPDSQRDSLLFWWQLYSFSLEIGVLSSYIDFILFYFFHELLKKCTDIQGV